MFRKLRNKVLLLNMITILIMLLLAFACIYFIMYQNAAQDIHSELQRESDMARKSISNAGPGRPNAGSPKPEPGRNEKPPAANSIAFSLVLDREEAVQSVFSRFEMEASFYDQAAAAASARPGQQGRLTLDDKHWAYLKQPVPGGVMITFLDVTSRTSFLTSLIYAFLLVSAVMLVVIYFISRYFANRSIEPVQNAFDKQKQFIADASHELKTPLAVINTNVDVLLANEEDTIRNQAKWLRFIKSESERMAKLTNDLLYLTQMDQANMDLVYTPFDISDAVEQVVLSMEAVAFEQEIRLSYAIEPSLSARGNPEQVKQVVMILLDNALKYVHLNGSVTVTLTKRHHLIDLTVANTGGPIPDEQLSRIFDRFYRTDPSRSRSKGGYGLGLAIAKAIVDRHKGEIYAKNAPEQTVAFCVQLPAC